MRSHDFPHGSSGAIVLAMFCVVMSVRAADIDFNHYASPTDNDLVNHFLVEGTIQQVTGNGITGGAVASQLGLGGSATYRNGQSHPTTMTVSFQYDGMEMPGLGPSARLGWAGELAGIQFFTASLYFWGEFYNDGSFNVHHNATGQAGQGTYVNLGSIPAPTLGHWLRPTARSLVGSMATIGRRIMTISPCKWCPSHAPWFCGECRRYAWPGALAFFGPSIGNETRWSLRPKVRQVTKAFVLPWLKSAFEFRQGWRCVAKAGRACMALPKEKRSKKE